MKRVFLFSTFLLIATFTYSQVQENDKNFNLGVDAFNSGNYEKAIDYFTLSINGLATTNAIVNRAISYYYIGDSCNFCRGLKTARDLRDTNARKLYDENCTHKRIIAVVPDSLKIKYPDAQRLEVEYALCSPDSSINVVSVRDDKTWKDKIRNQNENSDEDVYTIVEVMPTFPGGDEARNRFLAKNIIYPQTATYYGIEGTVYVSFIIDKEGNVTDVKIIRGIGGGCDEEAYRVVKLMPKWIPGTQSGKAVEVLYNMPIYYRLSGLSDPKTRK